MISSSMRGPSDILLLTYSLFVYRVEGCSIGRLDAVAWNPSVGYGFPSSSYISKVVDDFPLSSDSLNPPVMD